MLDVRAYSQTSIEKHVSSNCSSASFCCREKLSVRYHWTASEAYASQGRSMEPPPWEAARASTSTSSI